MTKEAIWKSLLFWVVLVSTAVLVFYVASRLG